LPFNIKKYVKAKEELHSFNPFFIGDGPIKLIVKEKKKKKKKKRNLLGRTPN
jgi:hypothetical protein